MSIGETMHRLETYVITHRDQNVEQWIQFSRSDMLDQTRRALRAGAVSTALLYWVRHKAEFRSRLDVSAISDLLECAADGPELSARLQWLRQFVPDILRLLPACLPVLAGWAGEEVLRLELDRKAWPENGLDFAQDVLAAMQFGAIDDVTQFMTILTLNQQRTEPDSALSKLIQLINLLQDLLQLKQRFRIKIKLAEFQQEDKFVVVSTILDWVLAAEEIPALMDGFLIQYMQKHHLNLNQGG